MKIGLVQKSVSIALFTVLVSRLAVAASSEVTADKVLQYINEKGARETIGWMMESQSVEYAVWDGIESGDPLWLDVANRLLPHGDAHVGESLSIVLGTALENHAAEVFQRVPEIQSRLEDICTSLPIDEDPDSLARAIESREKRLKAVEQLKDVKGIVECADSIRKDLVNLKQQLK